MNVCNNLCLRLYGKTLPRLEQEDYSLNQDRRVSWQTPGHDDPQDLTPQKLNSGSTLRLQRGGEGLLLTKTALLEPVVKDKLFQREHTKDLRHWSLPPTEQLAQTWILLCLSRRAEPDTSIGSSSNPPKREAGTHHSICAMSQKKLQIDPRSSGTKLL